MRFNLLGGYSVHVAEHGAVTEFETRNPAGEAVSVVNLGGRDAVEMLRNLRMVRCVIPEAY